MSNITARATYDIALLSTIILIMDRYMLITLYITGMIGSILNIITFLQKQIRRNSCSIYFLATSVVDFCIMNIFILMEILVTYNPILSTLIYSTRIWCKVGNYLMFLFPCLSSSYITLASFDRFCVSSLNPTIRKCSNLKVNRIIVIIIFMLWVLFGLHIPIAYDYIKNPVTNANVCTVQTNSATAFIIIDGFFFSLFNGAIVPFLLCILGLLIYYKVQKSRRRVVPLQSNNNNNNNHINRQNTHMIIMTLVQVFLTIIFNTPYIILYLLSFYQRLSSDSLSIYLYIIFAFISRWFYYMNYCKTFYINTLTSKLFRDTLRKQLTEFIQNHGGNIITRSIHRLNTNT